MARPRVGVGPRLVGMAVVVAVSLFLLATGGALRWAVGQPLLGRRLDAVTQHPAPPVVSTARRCDTHARPDLCTYIHGSDECAPGSLVNYLSLYYCTPGLPRAVLVLSSVAWVVVLFVLLASAADEYLVPALQTLSVGLHIPPDVAGLTLMALGNGAPDVFGTFAAVTSYSYGISVGELLGAGIYVTTVVVALVSLVSVATVQPASFVRDAAFYLVALVIFFWMLCDGYVSVLDASVMLVYYVGYVAFAAATSVIRQRRDAAAAPAAPVALRDVVGGSDAAVAKQDDADDDIDMVAPDAAVAAPSLLASARLTWGELTPVRRALWVLSTAVKLPLTLTCLSVDYDEQPWRRGVAAVTFVCSPLLVALAVYAAALTSNAAVLFGAAAAGGAVAGAIVFATTRWDRPPSALPVRLGMALWSFVTAIVWVYLCANELVALLQFYGALLDISDVILGATVLAWGASVGDTVGNVALARQGSPEMAMGAVYGGPLFNLLFGSSVSLLVVTVRSYPQQYATRLGLDSLISGAFLVANLVLTIAVAHWHNYTLPRRYGVWLIAMYIAYDVVLVLLGAGIVTNSAIN